MDTAGNVYLSIHNCDCGLTGGCPKCQTIVLPIVSYPTDWIPTQKEDIQKKLEKIRQSSIERYDEAWRKLAEICR